MNCPAIFRVFVYAGIAALAACATDDRRPDSSRDPVYRETEVRHARPRLDGEQFDPQEADPTLTSAFSIVDRKAERVVGNVPRDENFITHFWQAKQRILQSEYGISWRTPAELNPQVKYLSYGQAALMSLEEEALREAMATRVAPGESVRGMWREFDGKTNVSTYTASTDTGRIYEFSGHDRQWDFVAVFEVEQ